MTLSKLQERPTENLIQFGGDGKPATERLGCIVRLDGWELSDVPLQGDKHYHDHFAHRCSVLSPTRVPPTFFSQVDSWPVCNRSAKSLKIRFWPSTLGCHDAPSWNVIRWNTAISPLRRTPSQPSAGCETTVAFNCTVFSGRPE
jgi:hypothetical protein